MNPPGGPEGQHSRAQPGASPGAGQSGARRLGPVQWLLMLLVRGYRYLLKPSLGNACRFEPTCSAYALDALERHGALAGSWLAAGRLLRCHPWCAGGCDPVPPRPPRLFTRLGLTANDSPRTPHAPEPP